MIKKINQKRNQKGFTLVELIVVIAILGILASIAVPKLGGFTDTAKKAADEQLNQVIKNAIKLSYVAGEIELEGEGNGSIIVSNKTIVSNETETYLEFIVSDNIKSVENSGFKDVQSSIADKLENDAKYQREGTKFEFILNSKGEVKFTQVTK